MTLPTLTLVFKDSDTDTVILTSAPALPTETTIGSDVKANILEKIQKEKSNPKAEITAITCTKGGTAVDLRASSDTIGNVCGLDANNMFAIVVTVILIKNIFFPWERVKYYKDFWNDIEIVLRILWKLFFREYR